MKSLIQIWNTPLTELTKWEKVIGYATLPLMQLYALYRILRYGGL